MVQECTHGGPSTASSFGVVGYLRFGCVYFGLVGLAKVDTRPAKKGLLSVYLQGVRFPFLVLCECHCFRDSKMLSLWMIFFLVVMHDLAFVDD